MSYYGPYVQSGESTTAGLVRTLNQLIENILAGATPATGSVTDAKVAADAAIAQSKIAGLVADLAARATDAELAAVAAAKQDTIPPGTLVEVDGDPTEVSTPLTLTSPPTVSVGDQQGINTASTGTVKHTDTPGAGGAVVRNNDAGSGTFHQQAGETVFTEDADGGATFHGPFRFKTVLQDFLLYQTGLQSDDAPANKVLVQAGIDETAEYAVDGHGNRLKMPPGAWPMARNLLWQPGLEWCGDGRFASVLVMVEADDDDPMMIIDAAGTGPGVISNLGFVCPGGVTNLGAAIRCERPDMVFRALWASNLKHLFHFLNCANVAVMDAVVEGCTGAGTLLDSSHLIKFSRYQGYNNDRAVHAINGCYDLDFDSASQFLHNQKEGGRFEGGAAIGLTCIAAGNSQASPGTYDDIALVGVARSSLLGTRHKPEGAASARSGVSIDPTSSNNTVLGEQIDPTWVVGAPVLDPSPGTVRDASVPFKLYLSGADYASAPDSVPLSVTGDIDLRVKVTPASYGSTYQTLVCKTDSYLLGLAADRTIYAIWTAQLVASSVPSGLIDGQESWIRATRIAATGVTKFYTSPDGVTWTQLGADVASNPGALPDTSESLYIGSRGAGPTQPAIGKVARVQVRSNVADDGTGIVFDADLRVRAVGRREPTSLVESSANAAIVTLVGSAWRWSQ